MRSSLPIVAVLLSACFPTHAWTQTAYLLRENFHPGYQYRVSCRTQILGKIIVQAKEFPVQGSAKIDYDERILPHKVGAGERTVRVFQEMTFQRKVGNEPQDISLRPEVRKLVILRHNNHEVPFCPTGPLKWNEIDLVRTDVFTPALVGLFANLPVKPGDRWSAEESAVRELTDLEKITKGTLQCHFVEVQTQLDRPHAIVTFKGTIDGVGEDGPTQHQLDGVLHFDLQGAFLRTMTIAANHNLVDAQGKPQGQIQGTFVLTRKPGAQNPELADAAVARIPLEPNDDNTQLLFEDADLGVHFIYSRRWRVGKIEGKQIYLDERQGNGVLLTLESADKLPKAETFQAEVHAWLQKNQAKITGAENPRGVPAPTQISQFAYSAEMQGKAVILDYFVVNVGTSGAIFAGRLNAAHAVLLRPDVERMARSFRPFKN